MAKPRSRVAYIDVAGSDGVSLFAEVILDGDEKPFWTKQLNFDLPGGKMDEILQDLLGDGAASVTVGMDMKASENYSTAGCSVFVKLTCGQDLASVNKARDVAHKLALTYAKEGYEHARFILDTARGIEREPPKGIIKEANEKAKAKVKVTSKTKDPEPDRGQKPRIVVKGVPNFRR